MGTQSLWFPNPRTALRRGGGEAQAASIPLLLVPLPPPQVSAGQQQALGQWMEGNKVSFCLLPSPLSSLLLIFFFFIIINFYHPSLSSAFTPRTLSPNYMLPESQNPLSFSPGPTPGCLTRSLHCSTRASSRREVHAAFQVGIVSLFSHRNTDF